MSTNFLLLIIEKCLSYQTPLVLSFIDYKQAFDSADRRALAKVSEHMTFIWIVWMPQSTGKAMGDHGTKWGGKTVLDLDYAEDQSILDE